MSFTVIYKKLSYLFPYKNNYKSFLLNLSTEDYKPYRLRRYKCINFPSTNKEELLISF